MCRHKSRVQLISGNMLQQTMHVALPVLLGGTDGQAFINHQPQRELIHHAIYPQNRDLAAFTPGISRLAQGCTDTRFQTQHLFGLVTDLTYSFTAGFHPPTTTPPFRAAAPAISP